MTWLPTIEVVSLGVDPVTAGWYSFLYQIVGHRGRPRRDRRSCEVAAIIGPSVS